MAKLIVYFVYQISRLEITFSRVDEIDDRGLYVICSMVICNLFQWFSLILEFEKIKIKLIVREFLRFKVNAIKETDHSKTLKF